MPADRLADQPAYGQSVTASFSVARMPETTAQSWPAGYLANAALYEAKRLGWNRVDACGQEGARIVTRLSGYARRRLLRRGDRFPSGNQGP
jgi:hypothetical protein